MEEGRRVHPDCINASNPYHDCVEYCFLKIALLQANKEAVGSRSSDTQSLNTSVREEERKLDEKVEDDNPPVEDEVEQVDVTKLTGRKKKMFELRLKMNEARKANQRATVAEKKKMEAPEESRGVSKQQWLEDRKKKIGRLLDANGLDMSNAYMPDTQEAAEQKYDKWEKDPAPCGWDVFNQRTLYNAYKKRTKNVQVDLEEYQRMKDSDPEFYREASSLQYGKVKRAKIMKGVKDFIPSEEERPMHSLEEAVLKASLDPENNARGDGIRIIRGKPRRSDCLESLEKNTSLKDVEGKQAWAEAKTCLEVAFESLRPREVPASLEGLGLPELVTKARDDPGQYKEVLAELCLRTKALRLVLKAQIREKYRIKREGDYWELQGRVIGQMVGVPLPVEDDCLGHYVFLENRVEELEEANKALETRNAELTSELEKAKEDLTSHKAEVRRLLDEAKAGAQLLDIVVKSGDEHVKETTELKAEVEFLKKAISNREAEIEVLKAQAAASTEVEKLKKDNAKLKKQHDGLLLDLKAAHARIEEMHKRDNSDSP